MVSKTLVIEAHKKQLSHSFYHRGPVSSAKGFYFLVVLLSAISISVSCEPCPINEVQNHSEFEGCRSLRGNFESPHVADGHVGSEFESRKPVRRQYSLENLCQPSNSFCFPSTLTEFEDEEIGAELEELAGAEVPSEGSSSGLYHKSNVSRSPYHGHFRFLVGRNISCSLHQEDGFPEVSSGQAGSRNGLRTDVSSCVNPFSLKKTPSSVPFGNNESLFIIEDGFSTPPVEIKPLVLDWGQRNMYHPSVAYVMVTNLDVDNVLKIYDTSSSDSQFYPCESCEVLLPPGENASLCFVYLPTRLGSASGKLIIQTSFGGFLIQATGFSLESPYLINPHFSPEVSPDGRWRKRMSLFNTFNDTLHLEEVTAWVSISSGNTSRLSKSICQAHNKEHPGDYNTLSAKDWFVLERGESGKPKIGLRPHENWVIGPKKTETFVEIHASGEGKIVGALCMQLLRFPNQDTDTVVVPLEVDLGPETTASTKDLVSLSLEALVPCNASESPGVALSVRNDAPYSLKIIKVTQEGDFLINSLGGVILFPSTTTQVAFIKYAHLETREVDPSCKITVLVNDTSFSPMELPCTDVIGVCSGSLLDSSLGYIQGITVDYAHGGDRFLSNSMLPSSSIKVVNTREADELILHNWKSQATMSQVSVLDKNELLFPIVLVGNYSSQWITVKNPTHKPVLVQLILNSAEIIEKCRIPETLLQPSPSNTLVGNNNSIAPTRYGFSIPKDGNTEAFVHPSGVATLGPILFQPFNRCEWRSSALIRNNLSGVEWLSLRATGGSLSLVLLEDRNPVESLEFKSNFPSQMNLSSPETSTGDKATSYCSLSLTKEVYAKNMGDLPLEVVRIKVSGADCGLDGFFIHNCVGFSLRPGESTRLRVSYLPDFASATVQRDLELVLASGILVVPMKASLPMCLIGFCKRSIFWMQAKKAMVLLIFVLSLMYFMVSLLYPHSEKTSAPRGFGSRGRTVFSSVIHKLSSFRKSCGPGFPETTQDEALLLKCCDGLEPCKGIVGPPPEISSPSSVLNLDTEDKLESRDLRVKIGKEKGRRRRKKKSSVFGILLSEASSSQSGNSTPSSPLSPSGAASTTPKKTCQNPVLEARNPFSRAPLEQSVGPEISSKVPSLVKTEPFLKSKQENNFRSPPGSEKKPCVARNSKKSNAAIVPCAGSLVPWTSSSSSPVVSNSFIASSHARAPGAKLPGRETGRSEENARAEQKKYTYDIWGDHLFGLPLAGESRDLSSKGSSTWVENDSDSFFLRGPQTLVKNTLLQSVLSDMNGNE